MSAPATRLQMDARRITLTTEPAAALAVEIGYGSVAEKFFRHDPPTAGELESAIDAVEDALMGSRAQRVEAGTLVISDDIQRRLPGVLPDGTTTIEEVEARFQRLASASLGHPRALADGPASSEVAAALLILRECMHHLGFARLMIDETPAGAQ
jgi:exopolyphosphatase/pppGpp-phosphohydrolase